MKGFTRRTLAGTGIAFAVGAGAALAAPSGAVFTTNAAGSAVNQNHYGQSTDVYLNGGPGCGASRPSSALPDGWYAYKVTVPSGRTDMTAAEPAAERMFRVRGGAAVESADPADHPIVATACGSVMRVGPFAATSANGEYKLHVVPATPGAAPVFAPSRTKSDNFRLDGPGVVTPEPPVLTPAPPVDPAPTDPVPPVVDPAPTDPVPDPGYQSFNVGGGAPLAAPSATATAPATAKAAASGPAAKAAAAKAKAAKAKAKAAKAKAKAKAKAAKAKAKARTAARS